MLVGIDTNFSYAKAAWALQYLAKKDCLFISTNSDANIPLGKGTMLPGKQVGSNLSNEQIRALWQTKNFNDDLRFSLSGRLPKWLKASLLAYQPKSLKIGKAAREAKSFCKFYMTA